MGSDIGARADRLRLERLERPAAAHFIRRDALDIGLQTDEIHQRELLRFLCAEAGKLKIAVIRARPAAVALLALGNLRDGSTAAVLRCKRERAGRAAVEAEQDLLRAGLHDQHTACAAGDNCPLPRRCIVRAPVTADAHAVAAVIIHRIAAAAVGRCLRSVKARIGIAELDMISAERTVPNRDVRIRNNGDGALRRRTDGLEHTIGVIVSEGEAGTGLDLQMDRIQRRRAKGQTDADDTVWNVRLLIVVFTAAEQLRAARRGGIDAALRQLRRAAVRADGIRIRQRQRVFSVIDVILLRAEGRHTGDRSQHDGGKQHRYHSFQA